MARRFIIQHDQFGPQFASKTPKIGTRLNLVTYILASSIFLRRKGFHRCLGREFEPDYLTAVPKTTITQHHHVLSRTIEFERYYGVCAMWCAQSSSNHQSWLNQEREALLRIALRGRVVYGKACDGGKAIIALIKEALFDIGRPLKASY